MRHPFDGVIPPESQPAQQPGSRRSILKVFVGALAALFGFSSRSQAQTQNKGVLSLALGEAGGTALTQAFKEEAGDPTKDPTKMRNEEGGKITTQALNEEGATTKALREEGGPLTKALNEQATTQRVGEEGGITTRALGEEGNPPKLTQALKEDGKVPGPVTNAIGEDGGGKATTLAIGEEGGKN